MFVLQRAVIEAALTPNGESDPIELLPRKLRSTPQQQAARALDQVCEPSVLYLDLFCAFVNEMCSKVSEEPKRVDFGGLGILRFFI